MQVTADKDFLGRLWVPSTLLMIAAAVGVSIAVSQVVLGFALAEAIAALSIIVRLTWDRRETRVYWPIVSAIIIVHLVLIVALLPSLTRAPGGVYMLAALVDAALLTTIVRCSTRG